MYLVVFKDLGGIQDVFFGFYLWQKYGALDITEQMHHQKEIPKGSPLTTCSKLLCS
jgi:hypothetical protein